MGCLNSSQSFEHVFGNIHLSGPCNRSCYFCIGQHMMALDALNNLDVWPLRGLGDFLAKCSDRGVKSVFVTGTNTDPSLYGHMPTLARFVRSWGMTLGIRTNGVVQRRRTLNAVTCGSLTVCSLDAEINRAMMGGFPPNVGAFLQATKHWTDRKVNIVLGPENREDWWRTVCELGRMGIRRVNLREPYGQARIGNPLEGEPSTSVIHGMPSYDVSGVSVTYWDVHFCEVESVNLYASGRISEDYPITRGHDPSGVVIEQSQWTHGRHVQQWQALVTPESGAPRR